MTVRNEAFIDLEMSLTARLFNAWEKSAGESLQLIAQKADAGDFDEAYKMVKSLDLGDTAKSNIKIIRLIGMSAILFGAVEFGKSTSTSFSKKKPPKMLNVAVDTFIKTMSGSATDNIRVRALVLLNQEEARRKARIIQKAEGTDFTKSFVSFMKKAGVTEFNITSSLHSSRLSSWGYTIEAEATGVTRYRISEVLDNRICPICTTMHGKEFNISSAKKLVEERLSVEDPMDLKTIAPFPKQDKESVALFGKMNDDQLLAAGHIMPPFHPRCRGLLRKGKTEVNVETGEVTSREPTDDAFDQTLEGLLPGLPPIIAPVSAGRATSVADELAKLLIRKPTTDRGINNLANIGPVVVTAEAVPINVLAVDATLGEILGNIPDG